MLISLLLIVMSVFTLAEQTKFDKQREINELVQTGIYYYWNGGDLKKVENEFFKGITLKGKYDVVEEAFKKASALDPQRLDLRFSIASTQIIQGKIDEAIATYDGIVKLDKNNFEARILKAMYAKVSDKTEMYDQTIKALKEKFPNKIEAYLKKFENAERNTSLVLNYVESPKEKDFIVTLGYALNSDGTMHETLIKRLDQTYLAAIANPDAKIIVSGGVQKSGVTESYLMKKWLIEKGIDANRIIPEDKSKDTVDNALNSVEILKVNNAKNIILITSASHIRRAKTIFEEAISNAGMETTVENFVYLDYKSIEEAMAVTAKERLVIFRDLGRASGIWAYPGIQK
ncbi:MAG: YdcF family protein [Leptotrichiaceae bacterium]|nr:YdcF family protein [Leptotrichiaceae bacterium]MBP6167335.1 YdcF family protein [Leptotrichiaceae bacterium]MBP7025993.1 YdcF family protein [Leptotrichiaceae bacterium]MBP8636422.1 YdcF family protein [Leptotrichiaceae bacterium]MBP9538223.1 YdcF family protein [Leptotrichiaceae bacterium]